MSGSDPTKTDMSRQRIVDVELDQGSVVRWSPEIEHERKVAIYDLLEENLFEPVAGHLGPFALRLAIEENRIILDVRLADTLDCLERITLPQSSLRRIVRDYFTVCESYYAAIKNARPSQIEALDMARRGLHNDGSEILRERLREKVTMDLNTARRLFTLVCVLHLRP